MNSPKKCCLILLGLVAAGAFGLRLGHLAARPMHGDEAIHAVKFGQLLESGTYRYDRYEYHGPTLNYFTLISAKLTGAANLRQVNETTLRIVPVVFGTALILLLLLLCDGLGGTATIAAGVLTAISPAMLYYSRYYIQEMLLVFFTAALIAAGYRYFKSKSITWAVLAGAFAGLMHATKETCIIAFGAMLLALLMVIFTDKTGDVRNTIKTGLWHIVAAICAAGAISVIFYSSFFSNSGGIVDSLRTLGPYFSRASTDRLHVQPWYYYLQILIYFKSPSGPVWSEILTLSLAGVGLVVAMRGKPAFDIDLRLIRFIAFYTIILAAAYSAIPYKTPWCLLSFLYGIILLAGVGVVALFKLIPSIAGRVIIAIILIIAAGHLLWQSYLCSYRYYADPANPYAYSHPTTDVIKMAARIEEIAQAIPQGHDMYIQVICTDSDYWPLPWYLRFFNNVGWWAKVDEQVPPATVIIASADLEQAVLKLLYEIPPAGKRDLYVPLFDGTIWLRPNVELKGFIKHQLREQLEGRVKN